MQIRLLALGLSLALSTGCACHTHLLGTVEDAGTTKPVKGVRVQLEDTGAHTETNAWGEFEVDALCRKAPYVVSITAPGYDDLREELDLGTHEVWRTFQLTPTGDASTPGEAGH
jgi:hypothetical protein